MFGGGLAYGIDNPEQEKENNTFKVTRVRQRPSGKKTTVWGWGYS